MWGRHCLLLALGLLAHSTAADEPRFCCMAMIASCLACSAGMEIGQYCTENPQTQGCESCPEMAPSPGGSCQPTVNTQTCQYNEICCETTGSCVNSTFAECPSSSSDEGSSSWMVAMVDMYCPEASSSSSSPAPPPLPSSPPTAPAVLLTIMAAGIVDDYDESLLDDLRGRIATAAGVGASAVTSLVAVAGSVRLIATIRLADPSGPNAAEVSQSLTQALGTADAASSLLAIQVVETPTVEQTTAADAERLVTTIQLGLANDNDEEQVRHRALVIAMVVLGIVLVGIGVLATIAIRRRQQRRGRSASQPSNPAFKLESESSSSASGLTGGGGDVVAGMHDLKQMKPPASV